MLAIGELKEYFARLPRDLHIEMSGDTGVVNHDIASLLSVTVRRGLEQKPGPKLSLNIPNYGEMFDSVVAFLNGERIDVRHETAAALGKLADALEIRSLQNVLKPFLEAATSCDNVVSRILWRDDEGDVAYFTEHIEEIVNDRDVYKLPVRCLVDVIRNTAAVFESQESRYLFALRCAEHVPEIIDELFTRDFVLSIPRAVVRRISRDPEVMPICATIPYSLDLVHALMQMKWQKRGVANVNTENLENIERALAELKQKNEVITGFIKKGRERLDTSVEMSSEAQSAIKHCCSVEDRISVVMQIGSHIGEPKVKDYLSTKLQPLDKYRGTARTYVDKMRTVPKLFDKTLAKASAHLNEWGDAAEKTQGMVDHVSSVDEEMGVVIQSARAILRSLAEISVFLSSLTVIAS